MSNNNIVYLLSVLFLLLGVSLGALFFALETPVIVKEPQIVEIEKEVEVEKIVTKDYVQAGVDAFLYSLNNNPKFDKHLVCNKERYEYEQISLSKVYESSQVKRDIKDTDDLLNAQKEVIEFKLRLKYTDSEVQEKCYKDFDVKVENIEGEPSIVSVK